jgi:hypothetical protein
MGEQPAAEYRDGAGRTTTMPNFSELEIREIARTIIDEYREHDKERVASAMMLHDRDSKAHDNAFKQHKNDCGQELRWRWSHVIATIAGMVFSALVVVLLQKYLLGH